MSTAASNKLKVKDIITVVLLALINVVIFFASSLLYATPITIILMPVFFALLEGIVYFIIGTKVQKPGAILIYSVVRAIMKDAPIIILDEATANVDPENEKELMEAVSELTRSKTVIMIAHRLKTVRNAGQIFVVDHGEIVQQGTHDELVAVDGLYRRFVVERRQAAGWKV